MRFELCVEMIGFSKSMLWLEQSSTTKRFSALSIGDRMLQLQSSICVLVKIDMD